MGMNDYLILFVTKWSEEVVVTAVARFKLQIGELNLKLIFIAPKKHPNKLYKFHNFTVI
mgnify:CR=1 FL=1